MILRRAFASTRSEGAGDDGAVTAPGTVAPIRMRLAVITALIVAVAVGAMMVLTYWTLSTALTSTVEEDLRKTADTMLLRAIDIEDEEEAKREVEQFKGYHPDVCISLEPPGQNISYGDLIPAGLGEVTTSGPVSTSSYTVGNQYIVNEEHVEGATVVLAQDMTSTHGLISALGTVLLVITALGVLLSLVAGTVVATTGLRPLAKFQRAVDHITRTKRLTLIPVVGDDELAHLTASFNDMITTLQESRHQQTQLVADAGHELKTPLTSIRTNIELLMQISRSGAEIPPEDRAELEADVIAQLEEMTTLIGDLVDLARDESIKEPATEEIDFERIVTRALERSRRRRQDVDFHVELQPWSMYGDDAGLGRAVLNLLDNAVKWSPEGGTVRVISKQITGDRIRLSVTDSGPGIPPEHREHIFQRFYRAPESRSMPGSGLGLAIARQVFERHGGSVHAEESPDGGTRMVVELPRRVEGSSSSSAGGISAATRP